MGILRSGSLLEHISQTFTVARSLVTIFLLSDKNRTDVYCLMI